METEKRLIDAKELIRRICAERDEVQIKTGCDIGYHNGLNMGASMVLNAPTADAVEVVHGRWVDRYGKKYANHLYECSVCKETALYMPVVDELRHEHILQATTLYCPNCGAKMDGG